MRLRLFEDPPLVDDVFSRLTVDELRLSKGKAIIGEITRTGFGLSNGIFD